MLREAEKINKLSSVVKGLNRAQLLQRLDALETALCRGKADLAVNNIAPSPLTLQVDVPVSTSFNLRSSHCLGHQRMNL